MDKVTSHNGKLYVGMNASNIPAVVSKKGCRNAEKASAKLTKAFNFADKNADGEISAEEIELYDKEMRKKNIRTGFMVAGGVALTAITAFLVTKGIKANKLQQQLVKVKTSSNPTFTERMVMDQRNQFIQELSKDEIMATGLYDAKAGTFDLAAIINKGEKSIESDIKQLCEIATGQSELLDGNMDEVFSLIDSYGGMHCIADLDNVLKRAKAQGDVLKKYIEYITKATGLN